MKQATDQDLQLSKWIGGAALGALVMYMLDPERGAPRRAQSGEKLRSLGRQTGDALDKVVHGIGARMDRADVPGAGEASKPAADRPADSHYQAAATHAERMPSRLEGDPSARSGNGGGGGGILDQSVDALRRVVHAGTSLADSSQSEQRSMRGPALAGATVLGLGGLMAPRSPLGMAMGLAGLALLVRATGRRPLKAVLGNVTHAQPVELEKTIRIDAAPEQVFDLFANYENFPRFMSNVLEVRDLGNRRSHWVVKGPAGSHFAWNAVLTEHSRPSRLAWESEPGAEVEQSGSILFEPFRSGTRVTVRMAYRPPAGAVGHALASLLGKDPKRQMDEDLTRMKSLVERGAMTQAGMRSGVADAKFLH